MTEKNQKVHNPIAKIHDRIMNYVLSHWGVYNLLKLTIIFVLSPFLFFGLLFFSTPVIIVTILLFLIFMYLDIKRLDVAKTDPYIYLTVEKIEGIIDKTFVIVGLLLLPLIVIFLIGFNDSTFGTILLTTASFLGIFFILGTGAIFASILNNFEKFLGLIITTKSDSSNRFYFLSHYYVNEKIRIWSRLWFILNGYTEDFKVDIIRKKAQLFKESINIFNDFLREDFKYIIRKPDRFYKFVLLTLLSNDQQNVTKIGDCIKRLATLMESENDNPFEVITVLRTMINKPTDNVCDCYPDIEIEPHHFKKWIKANSEIVILVVSSITPVIGVKLLEWLGPIVLQLLESL